MLDQRAETSWGEPLITFSEWFFPAGSAWLADRLDAFTHVAELFGLTAGGRPTAVATTLLRRGPAAAHDIVAQLMPEPIETVYLQHDLTVVAPGPLAPELDARLRSIAEVESTGLAATYRISEARLQGALVDGETEQSLREFLGSLSSTGIPQPVDYLLSETAARHGRYRVSAYSPRDDDGVVAEQARQLDAVSRLRADDAALLDTIEVDHTLGSLALVRADGLTMLSRFDAETVYWALTEARYPVVLEDAGRSPLRAPARRSNRRVAPSSAAVGRQRRRHRPGLDRASARCRRQGSPHRPRDGRDARRNDLRASDGADRRRRRAGEGSRSQVRHRAHPPPVEHRGCRDAVALTPRGRSRLLRPLVRYSVRRAAPTAETVAITSPPSSPTSASPSTTR